MSQVLFSWFFYVGTHMPHKVHHNEKVHHVYQAWVYCIRFIMIVKKQFLLLYLPEMDV